MNDHYKHSQCETVDFVDEALSLLITLTPQQHWYVGNALKYACRAGYKDNWHEDARKCADFIHRAITGEWSEFNE